MRILTTAAAALAAAMLAASPGTAGNGGSPAAPFGGRAIGQGPAAKLEGIRAEGLTKLAKSTRQLMPGTIMRNGVNPGHRT